MGEEKEAAEGCRKTQSGPTWNRRGSATPGSGNLIADPGFAKQKSNMEYVGPKLQGGNLETLRVNSSKLVRLS